MAMRGVYTLRKPLGLRLRIRQAALIRIRLSKSQIGSGTNARNFKQQTQLDSPCWEGSDTIVRFWRKMILKEYSSTTTSILLVFHTEVHVDVLWAHLG